MTVPIIVFFLLFLLYPEFLGRRAGDIVAAYRKRLEDGDDD